MTSKASLDHHATAYAFAREDDVDIKYYNGQKIMSDVFRKIAEFFESLADIIEAIAKFISDFFDKL